MRRTGLSAMALACTVVLAGAMPAFADEGSPTPAPTRAVTEPSRQEATPAPAPDTDATPAPSEATAATPVPSTEPPRAQVPVVPGGAPNTGVTPTASGSGNEGALVGGGVATAGVLVAGAAFLVRRRRATGA
ncbi:sortase-dependent protein [Streptomyces sp. NPDC058625]|uniref:sortase-dependent protein n=1 Tax=Streptomyces sp. NPDC058625 TaxID=3346564 RepID=UPI0036583D19